MFVRRLLFSLHGHTPFDNKMVFTKTALEHFRTYFRLPYVGRREHYGGRLLLTYNVKDFWKEKGDQ